MKKLLYTNPATDKLQGLFDELIPSITVRYSNPDGDKAGVVYVTLSAANMTEAMDNAMGMKQFRDYVDMTNFNTKNLSAYPATGNFVIGKVEFIKSA